MKEDHIIWQGHPSWRGFVLLSWKWIVALVILLLLSTLLHSVNAIPLLLLVLFYLLVPALFVGYGHLRIKTTVYTITQTRVSEKYGIVNVKKEQAHIANITNTIINKNIIERLLRVARIDIDTANDSSNILDWWGVRDADKVEGIIDNLRLEMDEMRFSEK